MARVTAPIFWWIIFIFVQDFNVKNFMKLLVLMLCITITLVVGCSTFHVTQTDESPNERVIKTDITATAFFSSAQNLSKLKALQTDKTQSFGADSFGQQGSTNTVEALKSIVRVLELLRPTP